MRGTRADEGLPCRRDLDVCSRVLCQLFCFGSLPTRRVAGFSRACQSVVVASSFFLVVLHAAAADSAASVLSDLLRSSARHPLLQALCTSASSQLTLLRVQGSRLCSDDKQQPQLASMADALLQAAERGLFDLQAQ